MSAVMGFSFPWGCMSEEPQPQRRRIDRSMIGAPTNFVHAGHIGSGDSPQMGQVKEQMSSKGDAQATPSAPTSTDTSAEESTSSVIANALSLEEAQKQFGAKRAESSEQSPEQPSEQPNQQQPEDQQPDQQQPKDQQPNEQQPSEHEDAEESS
ncbi:CDC42 small effector protein 2 [Salpingoeca rosetta]|uniref:CDC42 small effector protein 2 n=1 Tax=Salpingoeca rosetta (strain ATCC 50818 / BSB-021) TaxID=946362 RepID=F2UDU4_SALR5|nr:CDC42 small effector protein 2 [Salpingoeca rosetta]EGD74794.1 CDC42 small effector protein 2 [Salpingoeca rosetta]|eukprot:XP_004992439.1 CDC42 small effector protein 2 [Salpingoeca rosetta]